MPSTASRLWPQASPTSAWLVLAGEPAHVAHVVAPAEVDLPDCPGAEAFLWS